MLLHYIAGFSSITKSLVDFIEGTQPKVHFHSCKVVCVFVCACVFLLSCLGCSKTRFLEEFRAFRFETVALRDADLEFYDVIFITDRTDVNTI